jgi:hypothetical protein
VKLFQRIVRKLHDSHETAYSYLMEVFNAHERGSTIAALYEGEKAAT